MVDLHTFQADVYNQFGRECLRVGSAVQYGLDNSPRLARPDIHEVCDIHILCRKLSMRLLAVSTGAHPHAHSDLTVFLSMHRNHWDKCGVSDTFYAPKIGGGAPRQTRASPRILSEVRGPFLRISRSSNIRASSRLSLRLSASWPTDDACDPAFA